MAGETGPIGHVVSMPIAMVIGGFFALACYNSIEIFIFIFSTFKRKTGLYFWSMLAANTGIVMHAISVLLRFFSLAPNLPMCAVIDVSWFLMVTGQAVVLYSRLHLVVGDPRKIRWVLIMIIGCFVFIQLPTASLFITTNVGGSVTDSTLTVFNVFERMQVAVFTIQEGIISFLYVYEASRGLKLMDVIKGPRVQAVNRELIALFILVVTLDITLMVTEYTNNFQIQTTYKPVVYSIKLKVEALVLNNLILLVQSGTCTCFNSLENSYSLSGKRLTGSGAQMDHPFASTLAPNSSVRTTSEATAAVEGWSGFIYDGRPQNPKGRQD
ncbi:hypothetical protein JX265_000828 [Neoarthrinium moseri]|uniref:DUF7703 domain-containing protein n=1 Tax=Neoarthrinium moseri TaxID=1658444 RepID=A0A9P9WWJ3_9PEZI|nr:uncharacterized protein JN550_007066 [Neoarthrinium moseri]KAI1847577.1 hypothetical protein JX266_006429 [Neoarthrinium moseri]KAI1867335.1 hypothetical protein JN550_007066 [Neoarthrinium moseri]KAI1880588.1 hypothetical protein JX265_000828 [Neoarthrinium moseri]